MANRKSNYPNAQQVNTEPGEISEIVEKMSFLRGMNRPQTDEEVEERVKYFFQWCADNDVRPGVELMALALGTTRQTLWNWQREGGKRGEIITIAKQMLAALIENWGQTGKINPAALCFLMKNNFGYSDNVQVEVSKQENTPKQSIEEIAAKYAVQFPSTGEKLEMPKADF